jgi:hypothetical protein
MEISFPRYLLAKQSVDDRALNRQVMEALKANLPTRPVRVIEAGAGMGNMLARLLSWDVLRCAEYVHVDAMEENIAFAREWLPHWGTEAGLCVERLGENMLRKLYSDLTHPGANGNGNGNGSPYHGFPTRADGSARLGNP